MSDDNLIDLSTHRRSLSEAAEEREEEENNSSPSLAPFLAASYIQGYWNGRSEERKVNQLMIFFLILCNLIAAFLIISGLA
jgi:hypothetical protein